MNNLEPNTPALGNLGGVMHSVQGLQQRLGDFSAEEVSKATEKAKSLISRLSALQRKLHSFAEIQKSILAARDEMNQVGTEDFELGKLNAQNAGGSAPSHAKDNKLFQLAKFTKASEPNTNGPISTSQSSIEESNIVDLKNEEILFNHTEDEQTNRQNPMSLGREIHTSKEIEETGRAWSEMLEIDITGRDDVAELHEESQPDLASETSENVTNRANGGPKPYPEPRPNLFSTSEVKRPNTDANGSAASDSANSDETRNALVPIDTDIDQRLLADLIKNYGEFMSPPSVPATRDTDKAPIKKNGDQERVQERRSLYAKKHPQTHKNRGELDQKLKKLVKEYGEYDLYSRRSPISLKTGVLGAFLLLAVLLAGSYFLLAPKAEDSDAIKTIVPLNTAPEISAGSSKSLENNIDKPITKPSQPPENPASTEKQEFPTVNIGETKNAEKVGPP